MKAYHFVGATLRDGRPVPKDGEKLIFPGEPILCEQGLHASVDPFDALQYAPGPILCLVECGGTILRGHDKFVCTERTILARIDATEMLRFFARMQAVSVLDNWRDAPPDEVLDYLMAGDERLRLAAESAARSAAARAAEWSAAARAAAEWSAWAAARAAWAAARREFNALVKENLG